MRTRVQVPAPIKKLYCVPCVSVTTELKATEIVGSWGLLDDSMDKNHKLLTPTETLSQNNKA